MGNLLSALPRSTASEPTADSEPTDVSAINAGNPAGSLLPKASDVVVVGGGIHSLVYAIQARQLELKAPTQSKFSSLQDKTKHQLSPHRCQTHQHHHPRKVAQPQLQNRRINTHSLRSLAQNNRHRPSPPVATLRSQRRLSFLLPLPRRRSRSLHAIRREWSARRFRAYVAD